jgi:hypothetical protein
MLSSYLWIGARILLALVFVVAVAGKLPPRRFAGFVESLRAAPVVGRWPRPVAVGVTGAEAATVVLLGLPATARVGLLAAAVLLVAFAAGITATLRAGIPASCRCFGSAEVLRWRHVTRNLLLAAVAVAGGAGAPSTPGLAGTAVVAFVAVAAALIVTRLDDIAALL